jgi:hypothetical protein
MWKLRLNLRSTCNLLCISYLDDFSYDFDKDGFIRKEDVRLILSHVPID